MKKQWLAILLAFVMIFGVIAVTSADVKAEGEVIDLLYDDRKELSALIGKEASNVSISNEQVTSKQVGSANADAHVLVYENGTLYAVGVGTATLTVDGTAYAVNVKAAPISLFMITGHSVGAGQEGTAGQSVAVEAGQAYSSYYYKSLDTTKVNGYGLGYGSANRAGNANSKQYSSTGSLDAFAAGEGGTVGVGSAFASEWIERTGEKIWVLNAAVPGSCINEWKEGHPGHHTGTSAYAYPYYDNAVAMYQCAQTILKNEIAAGHYTLSHMGIVQFIGANFSRYEGWTLESLKQDYTELWDGFREAFAMDMNGDGQEETVETLGLVPFWSASSQTYSSDKAAAYFMAASQEWPDVFVVSDLYRNWTKAAGLTSFPAIDYVTNSGEAVQVPTSVQHSEQGGSSTWSIFCAADKTHLSQVTYNAVGFDIGNNLYNYLYQDISATEAHFEDVSGNELASAAITVNERLSIVPVVKAVYGKNVTLSAEGAVSLNGNCIMGNQVGTGTVKVLIDGQVADTLTVTVAEATHEAHCACGGHASGMKNHTCSVLSTWTAWGDTEAEKTSFPTAAGNYYLVSDITISTAPTVSANINLCLNGFNINASARINQKANISITDCHDANNWGTFKSTKSDKNLGGLFFIYEGSRKLNFYGGNYDASETAVYRGGIAHIGNGSGSNATVNVYAGNFKGANLVSKADGTKTARGGLFIVTTGSTLNMYGGTMTGGSTGEAGGGIYINSGTTFNMYGGTIFGGSAAGDGGVIYNAGTFKMEGGTIGYGSAKQGGNVYNAKTMTVSGGTITMGSASAYGGNICVSGVGSTTITGGTINGGVATSGGGNICVLPGGSLTIGQASGKTTKIENGKVGDGTTGNGGNLYIAANSSKASTLTVTGGTISGGQAKTGGSIFNQGSATFSGGTITGGTATNGGNLYNSGTATVSGSTITAGKVKEAGGNIYQNNLSDALLTVMSGTISNGKATSTSLSIKGGNIYIHGETDKTVGQMIMQGGTITGGTADQGGNIYCNGGLTISGGTITKGKATSGSNKTGGNLHQGLVYDSKTKEPLSVVNMSGGTISDGQATTGGNVQTHGIFTMTGGTISGGTASGSAGSIRIFRPGVFTLNGGTIDGGTSKSNGGVFQVVGHTATTVYAQTATLNIISGTINGGSAVNGGAISLERFGVLNMQGGTINGGTASNVGGVIYIYSAYEDRDVVANISGGEIVNGTAATGAGAGVYITKAEAGIAPVLNISKDAVLSGEGASLYVNNVEQTNVNFTQLSGADTTFSVDAADKTKPFASADDNYAGYMICDGYKAVYADGKLSLTEDTATKVVAVYEGKNEISQYATLEEAINASANGYVKLLTDVETDYVLTGTVYIDLNGFDLSGITVSGTLYGMDSTTDTYSDENAGVLTATVTGEGKIVLHHKTTKEQVGSVKRYLTAQSGNTYTFHRFYVGISNLSIAPTVYGVGYKADFLGDETVKTMLAQTNTFGYELWLEDYKPVTRGYDADQFGVKKQVSLRIKNFLDPAKNIAFNEERANMLVNAKVYLTLASGEVIETEPVSYTFKQILEMAASRYDKFSESQQAALDTLGTQFGDMFFTWATPALHHMSGDWTAWESATTAPVTTGKYYLTQDVNFSATALKIAPDQEVTLCLNGHKIYAKQRLYYVSGTLNICDCCREKEEAEQGAIIGSSTGSMGAILYTYHGGEFNLYSGNLTATNTYSQGALIVLGGDAGKYDNENDRTQTFNMYGGKLYGGKVTTNGGIVSTARTAQINIYGGEISGGNAGEYGGCIYLKGTNTSKKTVLNIYGGTISGGAAGKNGGNIYGAETARINIYGGTVANGTSLANGGNIAMNCDDLHIQDGAVSGGTAVNGGNIFVVNNDSTDLTLNGGTITGGKAETHGGNLFLKNKGNYTFNNVTISDGYAKGDGGNMYIFTDMYYANYTEEEFDVLLNNCTVTGGKADDLGDSIYVMEADLTISGNTLIHNENGESLFIGAGETVELKNLTSDAKIYVSMAVPGTLSSNTAFLSNIYADDAAMNVQIVNNAIKLVDEKTSANVPAINGFSVGWYRGVITPKEPMPLDGMGSNADRMEKWEIKTELEAGFTVIADDTGIENAIMLVSVDTLFIQKELSDNLSQAISDATGIAKNRIFYSGSHTHSAVDHDALFEQTRNYLEDFYVYMTEYAVQAVEDLAPATLQTASIDIIDAEGNSLNSSRRYIGDDGNAYSSVDNKTTYGDPTGFERESGSDPEMQVVRFSRTGKDDVVMFNYQGHPFGWNSSTYGRVSAENWKYVREAVQDNMDGTVCTFFMGASGNQGHTSTAIREKMVSAVDSSITTAFVTGSTTESLKANGKFVASYIKYALEHATDVAPGELKVVNYTFEAEDYYFTGEDAHKIDGTPYKEIDLDLNAISIADSVAFITAPYEMFHDNGLQIKEFAEDLGFDICFVLTNSMGENKYIASWNSFDNDSTDGMFSSFGVRTGRYIWGTGEKLIDSYAAMLAQLKGVAAPDSIYKTIHVDVVDQNGDPVQNVMIELIGNGNTRNCSNADGTVDYYIYKDGTFSVNVVKCPEGYSYEGGMVSFENDVATVVVTAQ